MQLRDSFDVRRVPGDSGLLIRVHVPKSQDTALVPGGNDQLAGVKEYHRGDSTESQFRDVLLS